jgi:uncharacterized protein YyaL (SSP411 family)
MFKKLVLVALMFLSVHAGELHWAKNYQSAIKTATQENKPVLFIISRDTCKYCILLDNTTLKDDKIVKALSRDFVVSRAWTNKRDYIPMEIAQNTPGLPGIWFLYPDGTPMYQPILGYVKKEDFLQMISIVEETFKKHKNKGKK